MPTGDGSKTEEFKQYQRDRVKRMWADPNSVFNSPEYKDKIKKATSGKNHYFYGKHHSDEAKEKRRLALLGSKNHFFGKHHSAKTKNKIRKIKQQQWKDKTSKYNTIEFRKNRKMIMKYASSKIKYKGTKPEKILKQILTELKIIYTPQKWIGKYRVDFFISKYNLICEADGQWTHGYPGIFKPNDIIQGHRLAKDKWKYDKNRDNYLKSLGYNVIRFWEKDLKKNPEKVEKLIKISISANTYI